MTAPVLSFSVRDWKGEDTLRGASLRACGAWINCICFMAESELYGHLQLDGGPWPLDDLAARMMVEKNELKAGLDELARRKTFSTTDTGVIYCRRMVREAERRARQSRYGKQGGSPLLCYSTPYRWGADGVRIPCRPLREWEYAATFSPLYASRTFIETWDSFVTHRIVLKHPLTQEAAKRILLDCHRWGIDKAIAALDNSIKQGWRGVFEPERFTPSKAARYAQQQEIRDRLFRDYLRQLPGMSRDDLERLCDKAAKELPMNRVRELREAWGKQNR